MFFWGEKKLCQCWRADPDQSQLGWCLPLFQPEVFTSFCLPSLATTATAVALSALLQMLKLGEFCHWGQTAEEQLAALFPVPLVFGLMPAFSTHYKLFVGGGINCTPITWRKIVALVTPWIGLTGCFLQPVLLPLSKCLPVRWTGSSLYSTLQKTHLARLQVNALPCHTGTLQPLTPYTCAHSSFCQVNI